MNDHTAKRRRVREQYAQELARIHSIYDPQIESARSPFAQSELARKFRLEAERIREHAIFDLLQMPPFITTDGDIATRHPVTPANRHFLQLSEPAA